MQKILLFTLVFVGLIGISPAIAQTVQIKEYSKFIIGTWDVRKSVYVFSSDGTYSRVTGSSESGTKGCGKWKILNNSLFMHEKGYPDEPTFITFKDSNTMFWDTASRHYEVTRADKSLFIENIINKIPTKNNLDSVAFIPAPGTALRTAIMDSMRMDFYKKNRMASHSNLQKVFFKVLYLQVHGDWSMTYVDPVKSNGQEIAEPRWGLLHRDKNGDWNDVNYIQRISPLTENESQDALRMTPTTINKLMVAFPDTPYDIYPKNNLYKKISSFAN